MLRLVVMAGNQRGKVFDLEDGRRYVIGRGEDVDIPVLDIMASRRHAEVLVSDEGHGEFRDIGSANGTVVNGKEVRRCTLKEGDRVVIGETEMRVSYSLAGMPGSAVASEALTADTDMTEFMSTLVFCEKCNESIPMADMERGKAAEIEGKFYCGRCLKELSDAQKE